jgi:HKD family nuclease
MATVEENLKALDGLRESFLKAELEYREELATSKSRLKDVIGGSSHISDSLLTSVVEEKWNALKEVHKAIVKQTKKTVNDHRKATRFK